MIDHLYSQYPDLGVACLYADYKDQANQTLTHILGSFLRQFLTFTREPIPNEIIQKLQDIQRKGGKVGPEDNLALLKIQIYQLKRVFICIDALDELEPRVCRQLLNKLKELSSNNIRLFVTGRGHIESEVRKCFQAAHIDTVAISANEQDIKAFVSQQMSDDLYPEAMDETMDEAMDEAMEEAMEEAMYKALEKDIITTIIKKSQGM